MMRAIKIKYIPEDGMVTLLEGCIAQAPDGSTWVARKRRWECMSPAKPKPKAYKPKRFNGAGGVFGFGVSMAFCAKPAFMTFSSVPTAIGFALGLSLVVGLILGLISARLLD